MTSGARYAVNSAVQLMMSAGFFDRFGAFKASGSMLIDLSRLALLPILALQLVENEEDTPFLMEAVQNQVEGIGTRFGHAELVMPRYVDWASSQGVPVEVLIEMFKACAAKNADGRISGSDLADLADATSVLMCQGWALKLGARAASKEGMGILTVDAMRASLQALCERGYAATKALSGLSESDPVFIDIYLGAVTALVLMMSAQLTASTLHWEEVPAFGWPKWAEESLGSIPLSGALAHRNKGFLLPIGIETLVEVAFATDFGDFESEGGTSVGALVVLISGLVNYHKLAA